MKLIIDISDEDYEYIKNSNDMNFNAIKNGIPLPKNHGRLIDEDEILRELGSYHIGGLDAIKNYNGENTWTDGLHTAWGVIDDAETIIEAESEEE